MGFCDVKGYHANEFPEVANSKMAEGFIIYSGYGIRNSVEGAPKQDSNDNDVILQGTPDIEQDVHKVQPSPTSEDKQPLASSLSD